MRTWEEEHKNNPGMSLSLCKKIDKVNLPYGVSYPHLIYNYKKHYKLFTIKELEWLNSEGLITDIALTYAKMM